MPKQYVTPSGGFVQEVTIRQYVSPHGGLVQDTYSPPGGSPGAKTFAIILG